MLKVSLYFYHRGFHLHIFLDQMCMIEYNYIYIDGRQYCFKLQFKHLKLECLIIDSNIFHLIELFLRVMVRFYKV